MLKKKNDLVVTQTNFLKVSSVNRKVFAYRIGHTKVPPVFSEILCTIQLHLASVKVYKIGLYLNFIEK